HLDGRLLQTADSDSKAFNHPNQAQHAVPPDLHRWAASPQGPEPDLERLLDRTLGWRHARDRDRWFPRRPVAGRQRPSSHRVRQDDRENPPPELRDAANRDHDRRSQGLHCALDRGDEPASHSRQRVDRLLLSGERKGLRPHEVSGLHLSCWRKLTPAGMAVPKFSATVWPMSESVLRVPRFTPARACLPWTSRGTYSRLWSVDAVVG